MAISLLVHATRRADGTTTGIDTSGAKALIVVASAYGGHPGVVDSYNNVWEWVAYGGDVQNFSRVMMAAEPVKTGPGHTITLSGGVYPWASFTAWNVGDGNSLRPENCTNAFASGTSVSPGSITPLGDDRLVLSSMAHNAGLSNLAVSGGGLAILHQQAAAGFTSNGGAVAYEIQTTGAARNAAWSWTTSAYVFSLEVTFREFPSAPFLHRFQEGYQDNMLSLSTPAMDTTGCKSLLVVSAHYQNSLSVSDSESNSWSTVASFSSGAAGSHFFKVSQCENPITGSSHTFTVSNATAPIPWIFAAAFREEAYAFESVAHAVTTGTSAAAGALAPNGANRVVLGILINNSGTRLPGLACNSGELVTLYQKQAVAFRTVGGAIAFEQQSAPVSRDVTWSWTSGSISTRSIGLVLAPPTSAFNALLVSP